MSFKKQNEEEHPPYLERIDELKKVSIVRLKGELPAEIYSKVRDKVYRLASTPAELLTTY